MAKISLFVMARNAERTIGDCLDSAAPYVDEIVIAYGGPSTDSTEHQVAIVTADYEHKVKTVHIDWHDDFARARNEGWQHLTGDYALWLDADDILIGGDKLRQYIDANPYANCFFAPYHYAEDEYGNLATILWRERLVKNPAEWTWQGAIHEVLVGDPSVPLAPVNMPEVVIRHNPKRDADKGTRNLDILYKELERTEPDPSQRLLLYLYRENAGRGNIKEALLHANRFVSRAKHDDESYQVAIGVIDLLQRSNRPDDAKKAALRAVELAPHWPDAYFWLARIAYSQGNFVECIEWTKAGETKEPPLTSTIIDPRSYTYWPSYFLGLAYLGLSDYEMAVENLTRAAQIIPDATIIGHIRLAQQHAQAQEVLNHFLAIREHLGRNDEWLKVRKLFEVAPKLIENSQPVIEAHMRTLAQTAHVDDPQIMVDFYRGNPSWVPMDDNLLWGAWQQHPRLAFARKSVACEPPATILDIGSSDGFMSLSLAKDGHIVEGWDLDPRCVDLANKRAQDLKLRAHYEVGSIEDVEGKYDVALAFEIIEHLVDPDAFLDEVDAHARKVVITTPFLAWEGGNIPEWDKVEPKGHIRTFDLIDLETRIAHRGRIFDLYREPAGGSAWIFASYKPRQAYGAGTIDFLAPGTLEEWSPRKLAAEGLGGSETALIRLAEELFIADGEPEKSYRPTVYGRIDAPGYYNGVRYRGMDAYDPQTHSDVLVAWRYPEAADLPLRCDRLVLWMHDTDAGSRLTPARAARFDAIVVLSEWHKAHMMRCYPWLDESKLVIIGNGVDKARFAPTSGRQGGKAPRREPHRVAYSSSPDRGLDAVLHYVWPKVVERVPDAELHVYYGMKNIDVLAPNYPQLAAFKQQLANLLIDSKNVVQHGRLAQDALAEQLREASVWLYPSHNFDETYCISAVEAQLAGCIPVTTDRGALSETVKSGLIIQGTLGEDGVAEKYIEAIVGILTDQAPSAGVRKKIMANAPAMEWSEVAQRWTVEVLGAAHD